MSLQQRAVPRDLLAMPGVVTAASARTPCPTSLPLPQRQGLFGTPSKAPAHVQGASSWASQPSLPVARVCLGASSQAVSLQASQPVLPVARVCRVAGRFPPNVARDAEAARAVADFLAGSSLGGFAQRFISSGFDEMESLLDMEDSDMKDLGVPPGYRVKLGRSLRELRAARPEARPAQSPRAGTPPASSPTAAFVESAGTLWAPRAPARSSVEVSWDAVQACGPAKAGGVFAKWTFKLAPEMVVLFPEEVRRRHREWRPEELPDADARTSPAVQRLFGRMLMAVGCATLAPSARLFPELEALGARHAAYGATPQRLQAMQRAMRSTLPEVLGELCTEEVLDAWLMAFAFISGIMLEAGKHAAACRQERDCEGASPASTMLPTASTASGASGVSCCPPACEVACGGMDASPSQENVPPQPAIGCRQRPLVVPMVKLAKLGQSLPSLADSSGGSARF